MDGIDGKKQKANNPKVLVSKWGSHKHRILINKDVDLGNLPASEARLPKPEGCPTMVTRSSTLPWNLRARNKTATMDMEEEKKKSKALDQNCKKINVGDEKRNSRSKMRKNEPLLKLAVPLSKSEIQEDFLKMIGKKPPSRPKKRSRLVQQDVVNTTYLGLSLAVISNDRYDVPELPHDKKKMKELIEEK